MVPESEIGIKLFKCMIRDIKNKNMCKTALTGRKVVNLNCLSKEVILIFKLAYLTMMGWSKTAIKVSKTCYISVSQ